MENPNAIETKSEPRTIQCHCPMEPIAMAKPIKKITVLISIEPPDKLMKRYIYKGILPLI